MVAALAAMSVPGMAAAAGNPPLRDLAARRNLVFGTAATLQDIADPAYRCLIARECAILTPGIEAKWAYTEPSEGVFRLEPMDALASFAHAAGLRLHMHNLIWAVGLPEWTLRALRGGRGNEIIQHHMARLARRYAAQTDSWDVVNEPADPRWPSGPEGLCTTPWRQALGPGFIETAFCIAHANVPGARLLINDDDLEYDIPYSTRKRMIYVRLIEIWLRAGMKLSGFGLEAHLKPWLPFAERDYRRFLAELASLGLKIYVTELDVCDRTLPPGIAARDAATAAIAKRYLDVVLDEQAVCTVITWGLSDRTTWMQRDSAGRRPDLLPPRPLPYDSNLAPKPMRLALADAFRGARSRPATQ